MIHFFKCDPFFHIETHSSVTQSDSLCFSFYDTQLKNTLYRSCAVLALRYWAKKSSFAIGLRILEEGDRAGGNNVIVIMMMILQLLTRLLVKT